MCTSGANCCSSPAHGDGRAGAHVEAHSHEHAEAPQALSTPEHPSGQSWWCFQGSFPHSSPTDFFSAPSLRGLEGRERSRGRTLKSEPCSTQPLCLTPIGGGRGQPSHATPGHHVPWSCRGAKTLPHSPLAGIIPVLGPGLQPEVAVLLKALLCLLCFPSSSSTSSPTAPRLLRAPVPLERAGGSAAPLPPSCSP